MLESYYDKRGVGGELSVFRSKGFSHGWMIPGMEQEGIAMSSLPPFLRTLLVTDGTVTKSLESYYWEPVVVDGVRQEAREAESDIAWLDVKAGDAVLARSVQLHGTRSKTLYVSAFSVICLRQIPSTLSSQLLAGSLGIGELIRECGLETYRELQEFGHTRDMSEFGGPETDTECVYRTYRIVLNHKPAILVSECFPVAIYRGGE